MPTLRPIYLDGHATTPLAPEAEAAMAPLWHSAAANVNSPHSLGLGIAAAVERARGEIAALICADPQEIVFTSGATESNNIALLGLAKAAAAAGIKRRRIVVSAIEHKSVLAAAAELAARGFEVAPLPVDRHGVVDLEQARNLITHDTLMVSVMVANNEVGTVQPIKAISSLAREIGAVVHVDAAQAVGKIPIDVFDLDVDLASISSHKMYGPGGIGALFVSATTPLRPEPLMFGGGQEDGLRPGTLPGPLIAGFGAAARLSAAKLSADIDHSARLAERLLAGLRQRQVRFAEQARAPIRLPGSLCLAFEGIDADQLIGSLSAELCISSGSACNAGQIEQSHVLRAIGLPSSVSANIVRIYCGRYNTESEMDIAAALIANALRSVAAATGRSVQ